ncbi:MAG: hypothetical protein R3C14_28740 [Caldilineaceae bacterium]
MPKSIITAYRRTACWGDPPIFRTDDDALHWAVGQGAFADIDAAGGVYARMEKCFPGNTWPRWLAVVAALLAQKERGRQWQNRIGGPGHGRSSFG